MLLHDPDLTTALEGSSLLFDTGVYIKASKNREFLEFVTDLPHHVVAMLTAPPVLVEFTAVAKNTEEYNDLVTFFSGLGATVDLRTDYVSHDKEFNFVLQRACPKASYPDKLLCMMLNKFKHVNIMLVTTNHHDMPHFFDCVHVITLDIGHELHNVGFYKINEGKYQRTLSGLSSS